jgi:hypothetical protein
MLNQEEYEGIARDVALASETQEGAAKQAAQRYYEQEADKGLAEAQLDVETIKDNLFHLLSQDKMTRGEEGEICFKSIPFKDRILTDWGVDKIMKNVNFYVNKNNLLSSYDEKQIDRLMFRFVTELNDMVLLHYKKLFREATFEECKNILLNRMENKKKLKIFALEVLGKKPNATQEKEIERELLDEMENRIEKEISKIKEEQLKEKIRDYGMLTSEIEAVVYATFNRAWRGEERASLRRHTNISEVFGKVQPIQKSGGPFSWLGR